MQKYSIKVQAVNDFGEDIEYEEVTTLGTVAKVKINVVEPETWTNKYKTITITTENDNYETIRYTIDGSEPTASSTEYTGVFTVSENCTIKAVAFDNTNQKGIVTSNAVTKIDKLEPTVSEIKEITSNSATIIATDEGGSGIVGYALTTNDTVPTSGYQTSNTFNNLKKHTTHYVWVKDKAGNLNKTESTFTTTGVGTPTITVANQNNWTKEKNITISEREGRTIIYTLDGTTPTPTNGTRYTGTFTLKKNCTVKAIFIDSTNQIGGSIASAEISKIDNLAPIVSEVSDITTNSITIIAADAEATSESGKSEIVGYAVTESNVAPTSGFQESNIVNITLTKDKTYYAWAKDTAGNVSASKSFTAGGVILSEADGIVTYPNTKTFTITKNVSGGELSVKSSNESVATVSISGTTVTITPKVITADGQKVTITVTSAATSNYEEQTATYIATVNRGAIGLNATGYSGTYDGNAHNAVTINNLTPADAKLEYALGDGTYSTTMPTVTEVGTYAVHIRASKEGYITKEIQKTATIEKQSNTSGNLTLSATSGTITYPTTKTFTVSKNTSGGTLSVTSSNTNVATVSISETTVTITPKAITTDGQKATITVKSAATTNYGEAIATYTVTVNRGTITLKVTPYSGTYDEKEHNAITSVNVTPTDAKVEYALGTGAYSTTVPTVKNVGTYTISIKASKAGYVTKEITNTTVKVDKAIAKVGTTKYYTSLAKAIESISSSGTVTMISNSTENVTIPATKNIKLDLNGKTLNGRIINKGTLEVSGNASEGSTINGNDVAAISNQEGATLYIKSGKYTSSATGEEVAGATIHNSKGTVEISGGIIEQTGDRNAIYNAGTTTITGGTIKKTSGKSATINSTNDDGVKSYLYIKGGTIYSNVGRAIIIKEKTAVEISGGKIYSTSEDYSTIRQLNSSSGKLTIKGGTIYSTTGLYAINSYASVVIQGSPKIYSTSTYSAINVSSGTTSINGGTIVNGKIKDDGTINPGAGKVILVENGGHLNIGTSQTSNILIQNSNSKSGDGYSGATVYIYDGGFSFVNGTIENVGKGYCYYNKNTGKSKLEKFVRVDGENVN